MITPLEWDTAFFGRRIGLMAGPLASFEEIGADLRAARDAGFAYLICRPPIDDARAIRDLERSAFYLTDVGVTWSADTDRYLRGAEPAGPSARLAVEDDVPRLAAESVKLFRLSRFYHDPFYAEAEADRLHVAWVTNSVRGEAADAVWIVPDAGFVTCKIAKDGRGEVVLIGVWAESRQRGAGRRLMTAAMAWFASRGVGRVRVKTQAKNLAAMNFYHRLGFDLHGADLTMACLLGGGNA